MEVRMESPSEMGSRKGKGKRKKSRRPAGPAAPAPDSAAQKAAEDLCGREQEWLERLAASPASFAEVEREVHDQARQHADRFVAGLLAKASERPEMARHVEESLSAAEAPLRPVEKKDGP